MELDALEAGLTAMGISAPEGAAGRLTDYLALVARWNKVHNLTAILEPSRMVAEHVLDSLSLVSLVQPERILDVGSGAGLPGIPLAIVKPQWHVVLLDSSHKRSAFQRQAVMDLALANVDIACARIEQYRPAETFDTIVSRAFAETGLFASHAVKLLSDDGVIIAMKGLYPQDELRNLPAAVRVREVVKLVVPGLAAQRHAVIMTKA